MLKFITKIKEILLNSISRLQKHNNRLFMLILSVVVGLAVGVAAVVIKNSVHFIQYLLHIGFTNSLYNYIYFAYPIVGIFLAVLFIKFVVREPVRHGIPGVLYSISRNRSVIKQHNMFSSIFTSAFTVGFGGSVGLEGPTVATGAAIGSNIGRAFQLSYKQKTLLLGCACAGAMSAIFKAPIAAIVFALEVIMLDLTMSSLVPLLFASVSAALTSYFFLGQNVVYSFNVSTDFVLHEIPYYIALGILAGLISTYFTRVYMKIEHLFERIKKKSNRLIIGGVSLGVILFFFPSLYGEGYEEINSCLKGDYSYLFENTILVAFKNNFATIILAFLLIVFLKVVAASITFGAGGIGGIFAPTLFMGANTGLMFATFVNYTGMRTLPQSSFALAGMAGLIAGVLHAPLTSIFLIADLTGGYALLMPLMITSTISYATIKIFETNSVYTIQLAKRKELLTHHKDKALLTLMNIHDLIETDFSLIKSTMNLGELVKVVETSNRNVFPVIDEAGKLTGILTLNDIREIMFKPNKYEMIKVHDIMYMPESFINYDDSMEDIAKQIQTSVHYNFPVLRDEKYVGFVSRARVFSKYRSLLNEFSDH